MLTGAFLAAADDLDASLAKKMASATAEAMEDMDKENMDQSVLTPFSQAPTKPRSTRRPQLARINIATPEAMDAIVADDMHDLSPVTPVDQQQEAASGPLDPTPQSDHKDPTSQSDHKSPKRQCLFDVLGKPAAKKAKIQQGKERMLKELAVEMPPEAAEGLAAMDSDEVQINPIILTRLLHTIIYSIRLTEQQW